MKTLEMFFMPRLRQLKTPLIDKNPASVHYLPSTEWPTDKVTGEENRTFSKYFSQESVETKPELKGDWRQLYMIQNNFIKRWYVRTVSVRLLWTSFAPWWPKKTPKLMHLLIINTFWDSGASCTAFYHIIKFTSSQHLATLAYMQIYVQGHVMNVTPTSTLL